MRALITGGAGFIGSHLADALIAEGEQVRIIDDLSTGAIENIEHLKASGRFRYVIDTVMNEPVIAELIDWCDVVFHLAAAVGRRLVVENPVRTLETNIRGTEIVLHHANKKKKTVVLASSSEVYGKSLQTPFSEDDDISLGSSKQGSWSYACSKAIDEFLALAYWKESKLPVIVARFFNTVGPRQVGRYGMVLPNFVQQAMAGGPVTVYGDGTQTRSFCYVADTVRATIALARAEGAVGDVFNVGNEEETSIGDLAEKVRAKVCPDAEITYVSYDEAIEEGFQDMRRRQPDIAKLKALTGFAPTYGIDEIIDKTVDHFRSREA